jgi:EF hand
MAASLQINNMPIEGTRFSRFRQAGLVFSLLALAAAAGSAAAQTSPLPALPGQTQAFMQPTAASGESARDTTMLQRGGGSAIDAAFNRADRDGDGRLSRQEAEHFPALALSFEQIDRNHDSYISREEFNSAVGN